MMISEDSWIRGAEKPHTCDDCGETIAPGEVYRDWKVCWRDVEGFQQYRQKFCGACDAERMQIYALNRHAPTV